MKYIIGKVQKDPIKAIHVVGDEWLGCIVVKSEIRVVGYYHGVKMDNSEIVPSLSNLPKDLELRAYYTKLLNEMGYEKIKFL